MRLERSRSNWAEPNLSRLSRYAATRGYRTRSRASCWAVVMSVDKPSVAAYSVSTGARSKIEAAGGRVLTIRELMDENPKGKGVRILG